MGRVVCRYMELLIEGISPPIDRSVRVSALYFSAALAFSISSSGSIFALDVPMFTLTLVVAPLPIATETPLLIMITRLPSAIRARITSGSRFSQAAASFICEVIMPFFASSTCVFPFSIVLTYILC